MRIGDRVEVKLTREHGVLMDVVKYDSSFIVRLDSGEEVRLSRLEIRGLQNRGKRRAELLKKVKKGGERGGNADGVGDAKPDEV